MSTVWVAEYWDYGGDAGVTSVIAAVSARISSALAAVIGGPTGGPRLSLVAGRARWRCLRRAGGFAAGGWRARRASEGCAGGVPR